MKDLLSSLLRAGAGLKSEHNKHRRPNSHDQKAANQVWTVMGKGSCTHLGRAEQGNDIGGFSLTVSLGSHSLRKQKELKSPKGTLGVMGAAGGDLSSWQAGMSLLSGETLHQELIPVDVASLSPAPRAPWLALSLAVRMLPGPAQSQATSLVLQQGVLPAS